MTGDRSGASDRCSFHVCSWEKCRAILSKELVSHLEHEFRFSISKDIYHSLIYPLPWVPEEINCSPWYTQGIICPQHRRLHTAVNKRWAKDKKPVLQCKWHILLMQVAPNEPISFNSTFTFWSYMGWDTYCNVSLSGEWTGVHNYKFSFSTSGANQSKDVNL
jgi:hypothetical protein